MERMLKVKGAPQLFVLPCSFLLHSCAPIGIYMLTWYIIGQVSARPSVVYGGTYVLNKPDGQVVLIPSIVLSLSLKKAAQLYVDTEVYRHVLVIDTYIFRKSSAVFL
jgi:hypothetical protein